MQLDPNTLAVLGTGADVTGILVTAWTLVRRYRAERGPVHVSPARNRRPSGPDRPAVASIRVRPRTPVPARAAGEGPRTP